MIDRTKVHSGKNATSMESSEGIRIGAVRYLNSQPLVADLGELCSNAQITLDFPSRLADNLAAGELDVALIPSVEAFLDPRYEIISDACVATRGPVLSVKLYSRVHPGEIKTLALDEGSRTSAALSKILLAERYGVSPEIETLPISATTKDSKADAVLLIGDRAMHPPQEDFHTVWDLGEEWVNWTGLPFVFAMWVTRKDADLQQNESAFELARDHGLENIEVIATEGAERLGIDRKVALDYLTKNLHFRLGDAELMGLKVFRELAAANGLIPDHPLRRRLSNSPSRTVDRINDLSFAYVGQ